MANNRLKILSGPNVGASFDLSEGEHQIGRAPENGIVFPSTLVSKKHCVLVAQNGEFVIRDLGSANGTFVNGSLVREKKLRQGDRISVGDVIFQISGQRTQASLKQSFRSEMQSGGLTGLSGVQVNVVLPETKDVPIWEKANLWIDTKVMPHLFGLFFKYQWNNIAASIFGVMVFATLFLSISPMVNTLEDMVDLEARRRAKAIAVQLSERNQLAFANHMESKIEISGAKEGYGVVQAVVMDQEGRILAPANRINTYLARGEEALALSKAKALYRGEKGSLAGFTEISGSGNLAISIEPIVIYNSQVGRNTLAGFSLVSIDVDQGRPSTPKIVLFYIESLVLCGLVAGFLFLLLYKVTLKPLQILTDDLDKILKGELVQATHEFQWSELDHLFDNINSLSQRIQRSESQGPESSEFSTQSDPFESYRILAGSSRSGLIATDADQRIVFSTPAFDEMSGLGAQEKAGANILEIGRDSSWNLFIQGLLDRAKGTGEAAESYEFSGSLQPIKCFRLGSASAIKGFIFILPRGDV